MSINANYLRVPPDEWKRLQILTPEDFLDYQYDDTQMQPPKFFELIGDWAAIHFLLTGEATQTNDTQVPPPLGNVIMGGTDTQFEASYGMTRFLAPPEVQEVAAALQRIDEEDFTSRLDADALNAAKVFGSPYDEDDLEELPIMYAGLADFFHEAANAGDVVLLWRG